MGLEIRTLSSTPEEHLADHNAIIRPAVASAEAGFMLYVVLDEPLFVVAGDVRIPFTQPTKLLGVSLMLTVVADNDIVVDVNKAVAGDAEGSSGAGTLFTSQGTRPRVPVGLTASVGESIPQVQDIAVAGAEYLTLDIDEAGSVTEPGEVLTVGLRLRLL